MRLNDLVTAVSGTVSNSEATEVDVRGVTHNSSWLQPGDLFVAIQGATTDGHRFIPQAIQAGAIAVMGEGLTDDIDCPLPYIQVPEVRLALAQAAAELHGRPAEKMLVIGVTGTDGKTTTSMLTLHLLRSMGLPAGLISTIGYQLPDGELRQPPQHFTTPEAPQVQQYLHHMVQAGAKAVVLESSSHALAMERVGAIDFDVAIWTQLTSEHLDYHKTVEGYFAAKARLVERSKCAVLNVDDPWSDKLAGVAPKQTSYSVENNPADWQATKIEELAESLQFCLDSPLGQIEVVLPMIGRFNIANALAASAAVAYCGATLEQIAAGLATFPGVPGRMQLVPSMEQDPRVIVDFAHTPPSLEKALATVRATTKRELWVVVGSAGGPRDPYKRAPLGEVATRLADHAIFTEEDHRYTPLQIILDEMARGAQEAGRNNYRLIGNRSDAIQYAVMAAHPGDTIVLAGKGVEETMERDMETVPWDENAEARQALWLRHQESSA